MDEPLPAEAPASDAVVVFSGWNQHRDESGLVIRATLTNGESQPAVRTMSTREAAHATLDEWLDGLLRSST